MASGAGCGSSAHWRARAVDQSLAGTVERYYAALNALDFAAVEALLAPDAVYRSAGVGALAGRDSIVAAFRRYFAEHAGQVAGFDTIAEAGQGTVCTTWWLAATSRRTGAPSRRRGRETIRFTPQGLIGCIEVEDL